MGGLSRWYANHLKEWVESYVAELAKGLLVLLGLGIFRVFILALKWGTGMEQEHLTLLEDLDFWLQYATIAALGMYSVLKVIGSML